MVSYGSVEEVFHSSKSGFGRPQPLARHEGLGSAPMAVYAGGAGLDSATGLPSANWIS